MILNDCLLVKVPAASVRQSKTKTRDSPSISKLHARSTWDPAALHARSTWDPAARDWATHIPAKETVQVSKVEVLYGVPRFSSDATKVLSN